MLALGERYSAQYAGRPFINIIHAHHEVTERLRRFLVDHLSYLDYHPVIRAEALQPGLHVVCPRRRYVELVVQLVPGEPLGRVRLVVMRGDFFYPDIFAGETQVVEPFDPYVVQARLQLDILKDRLRPQHRVLNIGGRLSGI